MTENTAAPLCFLDTETTGLSLTDDIWEFAGIRREPDGTEMTLHLFIEHDWNKCSQLPQSFREDHYARFPSHDCATSRRDAAWSIYRFLQPKGGAKQIHIVGAVLNFDTERLALLFDTIDRRPQWHYHLIDVEALAVGWISAARHWENPGLALPVVTLPWKSDDLSRACGVDLFGDGEWHTAMGDARWAMRLYDTITAVREDTPEEKTP